MGVTSGDTLNQTFCPTITMYVGHAGVAIYRIDCMCRSLGQLGQLAYIGSTQVVSVKDIRKSLDARARMG
jgi:hypothetical protein